MDGQEDGLMGDDWKGGADRDSQWIAWMVNGSAIGEHPLQHTFVENLRAPFSSR